MFLSDPSALHKLQCRPHYIRNVCIVAHVDHGKTSLSDHLLSSNGIISRALAGKVRFLDSRADEQERKITMKSSSIALVFHDKRKREKEDKTKKPTLTSPPPHPPHPPSPPPADITAPVLTSAITTVPSELVPSASSPCDGVYLINLIDSPGHVDFSSEVSTAVRSSDGSLILVDVIEGLCVQTSAVMRAAWREGVKPVLVLNKMDRLIVEVRMSASEAYAHIMRLLETINAVASTFVTSDAMTAVSSSASPSSEVDIDDDKQVIFSPDKGNVVFASAQDCWSFTIADFAQLYSRLLGMNESALQRCLWGDYYYVAKEKKVVRKAVGKSSKPMFVQLVLDVLWQVYEAVISGEGVESVERVIAMMDRLGVAFTSRELQREKERKRRLQVVMQRWLPISNCVLGCVVDQLPSPVDAQRPRLERLWSGEMRKRDGEDGLRDAMQRCDQEYGDVIVFVSKMVDYGEVMESMRQRRKQGRQLIGQRKAYVRGKGVHNIEVRDLVEEKAEDTMESKENEEGSGRPNDAGAIASDTDDSDNHRFLGFARVFAGTLDTSSPSKLLHVYLPRYHPSSPHHHVTIALSSLSLYVFMGVDIQPVSSVPAGNVCGIAGLDAVVLKSATISSLPPPLSPFLPLSFQSTPIMRVALEPLHATDFAALLRGLDLLSHADPNVRITQTERGETVLVVSGELHLERCLRDLKDRFAVGVEVRVSEPLVAFRECVVREEEGTKGEVDFRMKKERDKEKERKGREKGRRRKDDDGDADSAAQESAKQTEKKRAREAEERRKKDREREDRTDTTGATLAVPDRDVDPSPSPSLEDDGSHVDTSSSLDPLEKALRHRHEVEEWTAGKNAMLRVLCVPLGGEVMNVLEEGRHVVKRMARKRMREERMRKEEQEKQHDDAAADEEKEPKAREPDGNMEEAAEGDDLAIAAEEDEEDEAENEDDIIASRCVNKFTPITFIATLRSLFGSASCPELAPDDVSNIWSFGPKRVGPNLLINRTDLSPLTSFITSPSSAFAAAASIDPSRLAVFRIIESGIVNGFQMATTAGPICEEPMMGVAFIITHLSLQPLDSTVASSVSSSLASSASPISPSPSLSSLTSASLSGQIISSTRSACRRSFLSHTHHLRLLEAIYLVHLQCATTAIGHLYPVLSRRRGRIVKEEMQDGANVFIITALLPLADSFGFSSELRKATGGEAQPQLIFSHWELMESDPFYQPRSVEDIERSGMMEEGRNVAKEWVEKVRKRKGLQVQEKVVEHAEKQRTLARKK